MDALVAVDVQRDFLPGGALAVPNGDAVIPALYELAGGLGGRSRPGRRSTPAAPGSAPREEAGPPIRSEAALVVATRDWHTADDPSFEAQGGPWPPHCVQGTAGAELDPRIHGLADQVTDKPTNDATFGTSLADDLRARSVREVTVGGLALEYCVKETALGLRRAGFEVTVALAATRHITEEGAAEARAELLRAGVRLA